MGIEFGFAVVPFESSGYLHNLYTEMGGDELREGVIFLETNGEEKLTPYLGFNWANFQAVNEITDGVFVELCEGDWNQRYVLLGQHREHLARLREMLPRFFQDEREKKILECLFDNADAYLAEYGERAALIIY